MMFVNRIEEVTHSQYECVGFKWKLWLRVRSCVRCQLENRHAQYICTTETIWPPQYIINGIITLFDVRIKDRPLVNNIFTYAA